MSDINLPDLTQTAIRQALSQEWKKAVDTNLHILQFKPGDIPTLNRLAKSYEKTGNLQMAKKTYRKVLGQDQYNSIATNNLNRLRSKKSSGADTSNGIIQDQTFSFIEEPGRTKTVNLTKLAPKQTLSKLESSQPVELKANKRHVSVYTTDKVCIGSLPDDLSLTLIKLMKLGNRYEAAIRMITSKGIEIFIRETKRSKRLRGLPSFPPKDTKHYYNLLPTDPISEVPLEIPDPEDDD